MGGHMKRDKTLRIPVDADTKAKLEAAAAHLGQAFAPWARMVLIERAREMGIEAKGRTDD